MKHKNATLKRNNATLKRKNTLFKRKNATLKHIKSNRKSVTITSTGKKNIDDFLFPFWYNKLPFPTVSDPNKLLDDETWRSHLDLASSLYNKEYPVLQKGTIVFHNSAIINPIANLNLTDKPFFFGLDAFIAIWYSTEMDKKGGIDKIISYILRNLERTNKSKQDMINNTVWTQEDKQPVIKNYDDTIATLQKQIQTFIDSLKLLDPDATITIDTLKTDLINYRRKYYFLNIYETFEDIPYHYMSTSIQGENPLDENRSICRQQACMHPQFGYHTNDTVPPVELSLEFTIPANQIGNRLKLIGVYLIDVSKLYENQAKDFTEFKAIDAIVLKNCL